MIKVRKKKIEVYNQSSISGITLITLVITIIAILILAAVTIGSLFGENGLLGKSEEAQFKAKMAAIDEQWKLYVADNLTESLGRLDTKQLYAGGDIIYNIIADEEIEMDIGLIRDIRKLFSEVGEEEEKYTMGYEGELYYVSRNTIENNSKKVEWCKELGIKIWDYNGRADSKVVNGEYKLVNRSIPMYPKIRYRICKRKNKVY